MKKGLLFWALLGTLCLLLASFGASEDAQVDAFDVDEDEEESDVAAFDDDEDEDDEDIDGGVDMGEGESFMARNAKDPDVVELPSGLQYKVIKSGTDPNAKSPLETSYCRVHYEGKLTNGEVFDSTYERDQPVFFRANQVGEVAPVWIHLAQMIASGDDDLDDDDVHAVAHPWMARSAANDEGRRRVGSGNSERSW